MELAALVKYLNRKEGVWTKAMAWGGLAIGARSLLIISIISNYRGLAIFSV